MKLSCFPSGVHATVWGPMHADEPVIGTGVDVRFTGSISTMRPEAPSPTLVASADPSGDQMAAAPQVCDPPQNATLLRFPPSGFTSITPPGVGTALFGLAAS